MAQRLHARRAVPALSPLSSHNKGGGREAGAAGPGGGWMPEPDTAACPGTRPRFCQGCPGKEVPPGNGSGVPPPAPARRGEPSPASPRTQPRRPSAGVWGPPGRRRRTGRGWWWHSSVCGCPLGHPKESGRKRGAGSITPSITALSPCCDPGMLCPLHSKTSPAPQVTTAEGHTQALPSPAPSAPGNQGLQSREQPCPLHLGLAEQDVGRQGLNRPPQPRVAKGNTKCQSHQPQYVRAPAKRSSAESALVQAVPAPLPRPGTAGTVPCPRGRDGEGLRGQMGARQEG